MILYKTGGYDDILNYHGYGHISLAKLSENDMRLFRILRGLLFITVLLGFAVTIHAEIPGLMNYQGRLTNTAGEAVADGEHDVTFKLYDESETVLWEESHTVATADGLFTVQLGSNGSPLNAELFDCTECRLGITVGEDPEISPRTRLTTVPYAFKSGSVDGMIQSSGITDEPGVAAFSGAYYIYLDDQVFTEACSRTINCPASGYVLAIANARIATLPQHTYGVDSYATVGISDVPNALPGNQDLDFHIDSIIPTGVYSMPIGLSSMFTVESAGSYTYYLVAYEYSGSISLADFQFNLVYFPTAYGTVDPVPDKSAALYPGQDIYLDVPAQTMFDAGSIEANFRDVSSLERDLAAMKARIEELEQQLKNSRYDNR